MDVTRLRPRSILSPVSDRQHRFSLHLRINTSRAPHADSPRQAAASAATYEMLSSAVQPPLAMKKKMLMPRLPVAAATGIRQAYHLPLQSRSAATICLVSLCSMARGVQPQLAREGR